LTLQIVVAVKPNVTLLIGVSILTEPNLGAYTAPLGVAATLIEADDGFGRV
jgi:hypothetical protein